MFWYSIIPSHIYFRIRKQYDQCQMTRELFLRFKVNPALFIIYIVKFFVMFCCCFLSRLHLKLSLNEPYWHFVVVHLVVALLFKSWEFLLQL